MKILKPFYFDNFKCIGSKCINTCCKEWSIDIDKKSFVKYKNIKGEFGKELNKNIKRNRRNATDLNYGRMNLDDKKQCSMLDNNGLCKIFKELGEGGLCNTCKMYPRKIRKFGDVIERNLSISCPEIAKNIVINDKAFSFKLEEGTLNELDKVYLKKYENIKYNNEFYEYLWNGRNLLIEIAQFKEIPLWKRLIFIKIVQEKIQKEINNNNFNDFIQFYDSMRKFVCSEEVITSLDKINGNADIKMKFIQTLLHVKYEYGGYRDSFNEFINKFNVFVSGDENNTALEKIISLEDRFNKYFKEKEYILENYLVYILYDKFTEVLYSNNLDYIILNCILNYSIVKVLLISTWYSSDYNLNDKDIIEVLYSFAREFEHTNAMMDELCKKIIEMQYDSVAYLSILVK